VRCTNLSLFLTYAEKKLDRRAFFTKGAGKVAQTVTRHAAEQARKNASRWIRPPFAIEELDFLIGCNRCGDCISACPHGIIFPLSSKLGVKVFNTPAMDLNNHGCHLCEDWPCINACEKEVLNIPELIQNQAKEEVSETQIPLPKIAKITINTKTCLPYAGPECGACRVCPVEGAMLWNMEKPSINPDVCTGCALCREACIIEPKAINVVSLNKT
jgi:ferredoxin-type protein NapG